MKKITKVLISIAFLVLLTVFTTGCADKVDKNAIRQEQERIVEYTKEKVEFLNHEDIKKIEFKKYERNISTGIWNFEVILNDRADVSFTTVGLGGEIYLARHDGKNIRIVKNKTKKNYSDIEVIYKK